MTRRATIADAAHGLLYVDKPAGITSHDAVAVVRRAARTKRVGHAGTLDPFATGLLVMALGSCTRLLPYIDAEPKVYEAVIRFGHETDTDDSAGQVTVSRDIPDLANRAQLDGALQTLTGHIVQTPPAYSAKHVDGQRAYDLARRGETVTLAGASVVVHGWEVLAIDATLLTVRVTCGGGTYIRALARDLGRALGSAAHCHALRRIASGKAHVEDAVALEHLTPGAIADGTVALVEPLTALGDLVHVDLSDEELVDLGHGRSIAMRSASLPLGELALLSGDAADASRDPQSRAALLQAGRVVGIAVATPAGRWQPKVVMLADRGQ